MSTKNTLILTLVLILAATIAGLTLWNRLPIMMASHWNMEDQVDGYLPRFWGVFLLPVTVTGLLLLFLLLPQIDPLKKNIVEFWPAFNLFIFSFVTFMVYIHVLTLLFNLGYTFPMSRAMLPAMGLLFYFVGALLEKAKRNWFIGIRTPWTLSSDSVWAATHRLGAILFKVCAAFVVLGALLGGVWAAVLVFAPLLGAVLFLAVYSYLLFRKETAADA